MVEKWNPVLKAIMNMYSLAAGAGALKYCFLWSFYG